ncbi:MAG: nucleotidyl transferase AbiEii/AbiGii toxin family protein [Muribaculaceae bacterium]|nr:nucleotidyl transferase AbiEii/AbiGii toxin family protein [Muribaculaceae bacterium]
MIPELAIQEWQEHAPWPEVEQVEQDLLICRALVEIYSDPFLAKNLSFRGGTALHKLFLSPQPRYSEDIDLVQVKAAPIKETIMHLQEALSFLGDAYIKQKRNNNTLLYRIESEVEPRKPIRIKVEINCKEHFSVFPMIKVPFIVENKWFNGQCEILTYQIDELLGTKLRALYQRRKGRDMFDLYKALTTVEINEDKVLECYRKYMDFVVDHIPTYKEYILNMEDKMQDDEFLGDTVGIIRSGENYDAKDCYALVKSRLLDRMNLNK